MDLLYSQKCRISHRKCSFTIGCKIRQYFPDVLDHEYSLKLLDSMLCCLLHLLRVCFLGQISQKTYTQSFFILMIPYSLVRNRYQGASISQDGEIKFGCLYTSVNMWLLYPELEDLILKVIFKKTLFKFFNFLFSKDLILKLHQYRFLYQITAVH